MSEAPEDQGRGWATTPPPPAGSAGAGGPVPGGWPFYAGAGVLVGAALLLRLWHLGVQEVWFDEAFSFYMATTREVLGELLRENSPPLYYLLLRGWIALLGSSEGALRLLSALGGTLAVAAIIWAGRELVAPAVGLWSGAVAALAPIHIYYSQEARAYALLTLGLALTYGALGRALTTNAGRWWGLTAASATFSLYTHYFALLGLLPAAGLLGAWPARGRRALLALGGSALLLLPWVVWSFLLTPHPWTPFAWIRDVWEATPPARAIPLSLEVFGLGGQAGLLPISLKQFTTLEFPAPLRLLGLAVLALLGLWVAGPWGEARLGVPELARRKGGLALLLLGPLALLWLVSFVKPLYAVGRYDLIAFPAFTWLLGLALWKLQRLPRAGPLGAALAALLLLLPIGTKLWRYYEAASGWDARPAAEILDAGAADGDVVVFTGLRGLPVLYYLSRLGFKLDERHGRADLPGRQLTYRMYPRNSERTLATSDASRILASPDALREDVQDYVAALRPQDGTLWVGFERGIISRKAVGVSKVDALLVQELRAQGFHALPVGGAPGILRFQRGG